MNHRKVTAFTLMEVTIAMLLSAIVIAITYTSFSIVVKYYGSYTKKNAEIAELNTLDHLLKRDFDWADTILKDSVGIALKISNKIIKYDFETAYVVRKAAGIDTFKVQTKGLNTTFKSVPVDLQQDDEQNRIDEVSFTLLYQKEEIPYHYYKLYSSDNLINRNPNAVN